MPLGLILVGWDNKIGSVIDATYPQDFSISREIINKILMTHGFSNKLEPELLEIKYINYIVFSYCDKTKVSRFGYEMVMLILDKKEEHSVYDLKKLFQKGVEKLGRTTRDKRIKEFQIFAKSFFQKRLSKKILLIGLPSTGKTTIKKVFFEGSNAQQLLKEPLEPTRGFTHFIYNWLDLELGMGDSSGQEINSYLTPGAFEQEIAFNECDAVIYNFDYIRWTQDKQIIFDNIQKTIDTIKNFSKTAKIFAFCHKIDLIEESKRVSTFSEISEEFKSKFNIPLFFTSINKNHLHLLYKNLQKIISSLSPLSAEIEKILSKTISSKSKTLALLINKEGSVINQYISSDYNFINGMIIKEYYNLTNEILSKFKDNRIDVANVVCTKKLNVLIRNMTGIHQDIDGLIVCSESIKNDELKIVLEEIGEELSKMEILKKEITPNILI